jgi:16S rRNA (guanine966-N2)-methyltransferase
VRPVADRVREGLFSSLGDLVADARVLDLYAGTGALGIEALSRGADHATFVERARRTSQTIRDNLRRTGLGERATVRVSDALGALEGEGRAGRSYDLVLADPPYDQPVEEVEAVVAAAANALVSVGGRLVLTRPSRNTTLVVPVHCRVAKRLEYGDTVVLIFGQHPTEA